MKKRLFVLFIALLILPALACCQMPSPLDVSDPIIQTAVDFLAAQGYLQVRVHSKEPLQIPEDMNAPNAEIFYLQGLDDDMISRINEYAIYDISVDVLNHALNQYNLSTGETNVHVWVSEGKVIGGSSAPYVYVYDEENPYVAGEEIPSDQPTALSSDHIWNLYGKDRRALEIVPPVRTPYPLDSAGNTLIPTPTPAPTPTPDPATYIDKKTVEGYAAVIDDLLARKSELNGPMEILVLDLDILAMTPNDMNYLMSLYPPPPQIIVSTLQELQSNNRIDGGAENLGVYLMLEFESVTQTSDGTMVVECRKIHSNDDYVIMRYTLQYTEEGGWQFTEKQEMVVQ